MESSFIQHAQGIQHQGQPVQNEQSKTNVLTDFSETLQGAIEKVDEQQKIAQDKTNQLIAGEVEDLHQVNIAAEQANLSLQLTVQVRNKVIEAYEEIMRMQV